MLNEQEWFTTGGDESKGIEVNRFLATEDGQEWSIRLEGYCSAHQPTYIIKCYP